jgi:hypothetical protein
VYIDNSPGSRPFLGAEAVIDALLDLTKHWAFNSDTDSCTPAGTARRTLPQSWNQFPTRGLAAVTWILFIAFALTSDFVLRHSKLARRDHLTAIAVAAQLRAWVSKTPPRIRAPDRAARSRTLEPPPLARAPADRSHLSSICLWQPG